METLVQVHALVIEDTFEEAAFIDVTATEHEVLFPTVFETKHILILGEGVGDEVTSERQAGGLSDVPAMLSWVGSSN